MCMIVGKQEGKKGDTVTLKSEGFFIFVLKKKIHFNWSLQIAACQFCYVPIK